MYNEARNKMKFGDVIAFSGKGHMSNIIKAKTDSDISHVGMVLDVIGSYDDKRVMLIESTSLVDLPDAVSRQVFKGVQIHQLSKRLKSYSGQAYWLPLKKELNEEQKDAAYKWLMTKHGMFTPYDSAQAMGSALDLWDSLGFENEEDYGKLFCSELVSKALKIVGLFEGNPSEQTPADVMNFDFLGDRVQIA